jgi:hypothetical protein
MERRFARIEFKVGCSGSFLYLARTDARCANSHLLLHARHHRPHTLQVRIPAPPPRVVGVADHVSIMRPFAAELTLQCHFSSCLIFIWAWVFRSKCRQTKLLILADRLLSAKRAFRAFRVPDGFAVCGVSIQAGFPALRVLRPAARPSFHALFYGTGLGCAVRTSNSSNRIETTRFVRLKWPLLAARTIVGLVPRA